MARAFAWLLVLVLGAALLAGVEARSNGAPGRRVIDTEGCTCHGGGSPNSGTSMTVTGVPAAYTAGARYHVNVTSTTTVANVGSNKGGFLAWASQGTFEKRPGSEDWYSIDAPNEPMTNGTHFITHNSAGDQQANQAWWFVWKAPATASGAIVFKVFVNRVDGASGANELDGWNRKTFSISAPIGTPTTPTTKASASPTTKASSSSATTDGSSPVPGTETPAIGPLTLLLALLAAAGWRSRRR